MGTPPPPRDVCLLPEVSYTPTRKDRSKSTVNKVSAVSATDVKEIVTAELAAIIQDTKFSMREQRTGKDCYGTNESGSDDYDDEPRRAKKKTYQKPQQNYSSQNQNRNYSNNNYQNNSYSPRNNQQQQRNYSNQNSSNYNQRLYNQPSRSYNNGNTQTNQKSS